jgi:hypothetical protein
MIATMWIDPSSGPTEDLARHRSQNQAHRTRPECGFLFLAGSIRNNMGGRPTRTPDGNPSVSGCGHQSALYTSRRRFLDADLSGDRGLKSAVHLAWRRVTGANIRHRETGREAMRRDVCFCSPLLSGPCCSCPKHVSVALSPAEGEIMDPSNQLFRASHDPSEPGGLDRATGVDGERLHPELRRLADDRHGSG